MSTHRMRSRRNFLKTSTGLLAGAPWVSRMQRAMPASKFDPHFATASQAIRAIESGAISSRELTEETFAQIRKHNPRINAFVTLLEEQALERARQADQAQSRGQTWGPLHGLPILVKDSFATAGVRTTSGSKQLEKHVPAHDAIAVERLKRAGAILVGKTNMPEFASDLQSYNEVAGTTNNPWDAGRTPGGSTGGGAAALAAGFGFLELGSDIGGSIQTPAHFCGIYGHKSSLGLVPLDGHVPPPPGRVDAIIDLGVAGPMARSAQDLLLELQVIAGPKPAEARAYRWNLPAARGASLRDYRIGYVLDDPFCRVSSEVGDVLASTIEALRKRDVTLTEGWPAGIQGQANFDLYLPLLAAAFSTAVQEEGLKVLRESGDKPWAYHARKWLAGIDMAHKDWLVQSGERLKYRALWQEYFQTHDAFLMPVNFIPAFRHDHNLSFFERTVDTPQGKRQYGDMLRWISFATLSGCPATVAPAGRTPAGLPVGIQILGPFLEDATPIDLAGRLADVIGGFTVPPGFSSGQ